jgi:hypothetical protein
MDRKSKSNVEWRGETKKKKERLEREKRNKKRSDMI